MDCNEYRERVTPAVDGALPEREMRQFESHIGACGGCRKEYQLKSATKRFVHDRVAHVTTPGTLRLRISRQIREFKPDLIVVHGDRVEALAGASVGALNNILVAHIEGGELSGTVDGILLHAVSKLSHLHFVANEDAANRLRQMGESAILP